MNYDYIYADAYLEVMSSHYLKNDPVLRRIRKSIIKTVVQREDDEGKPYVCIWVEGDSFYFRGTMEEFDKACKTVYI